MSELHESGLMRIFAVLARKPEPELESLLASSYSSKHYRFADRIWFVASVGTARDVAEKLNVRNGGITGVIVIPVGRATLGVASVDLWKWLAAAAGKMEGRP
jgi:hypothetical protein